MGKLLETIKLYWQSLKDGIRAIRDKSGFG